MIKVYEMDSIQQNIEAETQYKNTDNTIVIFLIE